MPTRLPRDPAHPDFPHGTLHGYNGLKCRCSRCRYAAAKAKARAQYRRLNGQLAATDLVDAAPALARLREWAETYSACQIARMTGLSSNHVSKILRVPPAKMTAATVRAIMRTPPPEQPDKYVPLERYRQRLYSLAAHGYPLTWIGGQVGSPQVPAHRPHPGGQVRTSVFETLDELYRRIEKIPAADHPAGFTKRQITIAKSTARKHGFYPPACYEDDGTLVPEAIRNERVEDRKAEQDKAVRTRLAALHLSLRGMPPRVVCTRTGLDRDVLRKNVLSEAGVWFDTKSAADGHVVATVNPQCAERASWLIEQLNEFEIDVEADPVETAWRLGLRSGLRLTKQQRAALAPATETAGDAQETPEELSDAA